MERWFQKKMYVGPLSPPSYQPLQPGVRYSNQFYVVGDYLICKEAEGTVDTIEWSVSFDTWCYRLVGRKAPFWVYQTDRTLNKKGARRPPPHPPLPLPDPVAVWE